VAGAQSTDLFGKLETRFLNSKVPVRALKRLLPLTSLVLLFIVLSLASSNFLRLDNQITILRQATVVTIIAIGMTMIMIAGEIDLSVGSLSALAGVYATQVLSHVASHGGIETRSAEWRENTIAILMGLAVGALCGLINGLATTRLRVPSFIATLGTLGVFRGVALLSTQGIPITDLPSGFGVLADGNLFGIVPVPVVFLAVIAVIGHYLLHSTLLGRYCFAMGSNRSACVHSGINVRRFVLAIFIVAGAMTGLAGVIEASRLISGQPTTGEGYELDAIAAVVIGGGTLTGGEGSVTGTIIGSFIMALIRNGTNLLGISPFVQRIVIGAVIVAVVGIDELRRVRFAAAEATTRG
jgi:ribose transport system permease protein